MRIVTALKPMGDEHGVPLANAMVTDTNESSSDYGVSNLVLNLEADQQENLLSASTDSIESVPQTKVFCYLTV